MMMPSTGGDRASLGTMRSSVLILWPDRQVPEPARGRKGATRQALACALAKSEASTTAYRVRVPQLNELDGVEWLARQPALFPASLL
jgi:hypothetical protein